MQVVSVNQEPLDQQMVSCNKYKRINSIKPNTSTTAKNPTEHHE